MTIEHRTTRLIAQPPHVVHARLLQFAGQIRDEMPPIKQGDRLGRLLGIYGDVGVEIKDGGPSKIELQTRRGRIRVRGTADLEPTIEGDTNLTLGVIVQSSGLLGRLMLGIASAFPVLIRILRQEADRSANELAEALSKPDAQWNAGRLRTIA